MINAEDLASFLTERFGLAVRAIYKYVPEGHLYQVQPIDVAHTIGFTMDFTVGWRSISACFVPGNFAGQLVAAMHRADPDQLALFQVFVQSALALGAEICMQINGTQVEITCSDNWPRQWRSISFNFRKGSLVFDTEETEQLKILVFSWVARFFGIILSLLPVEPIEEEFTGEEEGKEILTRVKKYERSHINRAACIELHGVECKVCGMDFGDTYGSIGEGFIHIHHVEPLSMMDGPYVINPAKDLIPVCPNCHAMLHKRRPPLTIDELQEILVRTKQT